MYKIVLFLAAFFISESISTQQMVTDRPDQTESASTVLKGSLQIESGGYIEFREDDLETINQVILPTTLFRYGLFEGVEIRVLNQIGGAKSTSEVKSRTGIYDIEIGSKIQIFQNKNTHTQIAFLSHLSVPTGSPEITKNKIGTINKLSVSHLLSEKIGIGYNLGFNYFGTGNGDLTYSISMASAINAKAGIYLELFGELTAFNQHVSNFDAGFTYLITDNFQLDFSFGTGLNNGMNYIAFGLSWNIHDP